MKGALAEAKRQQKLGTLARALGVHPSIVHAWARGTRAVPAARVDALTAALAAEGIVVEKARRAPARRRAAPSPEARERMAALMRERWASGAYAHRRPRPNALLPSDEALVRELAGTMSAAEIAAELGRRTGIPRATRTVRTYASRMGISLWVEGWTPRSLAPIFGVDQKTIIRNWVSAGLLVGQAVPGRKRGRARILIADAAARAFITGHPYAYDWRRMKPGHPLTALAQVANRRDPWLETPEVAAYYGIDRGSIHRWRRAGRLPEPRWRYGRGLQKGLVFRATELPPKVRVAA